MKIEIEWTGDALIAVAADLVRRWDGRLADGTPVDVYVSFITTKPGASDEEKERVHKAMVGVGAEVGTAQ